MDLRDARRSQTLVEAERLKDDLTRWVEWRKGKDVDGTGYRGRYNTQLSLISSEVSAAAERIRVLASDDAVSSRPTGQIFKEYNLHDQRLIWIRYAWDYFRQKLDQRDDDTLNPILQSADEVSWASYSIFFRSAGLPVPAAPIPYIEFDYVPSALRTGQAHVLNRKPGADAGPLKDYFQDLPVPLLRLPPTVVSAPWSLALICHEVGHILQGHLEPNLAFFATFAKLVSEAIDGVQGTSEDQKKWAAWSQEVFADLCMAATAGPWSVWALIPWIITTEDKMDAPLDKYPPPAVRLYLLGRMSQAAGLPSSSEILSHLDMKIADYPLADAVAVLAARRFTVNGKARTIGELLGCSPEAMGKNGRINYWSAQLLGKGTLMPESDRTSARDAAVAASRAHFMALQSGVDVGTLRALQSNATTLIRDCHDTGVRAGTAPAAPVRSLSDALFDLPDDELLM